LSLETISRIGRVIDSLPSGGTPLESRGVSDSRSDLVRRVLGCLRDHPHDDTVKRIVRRLGFVEHDAVAAALEVLREDGLARRAGEHWALTARGWESARRQDPDLDLE
jgi:hypothetical protein